jgi:flavin-dependent dehydrogenase
MDETTADVAIVGGGIAGGARAVRLARAAWRKQHRRRIVRD